MDSDSTLSTCTSSSSTSATDNNQEAASSTSSISTSTTDQPIGFSDIDADQMPTEIESLCMNCGENGMTRMLLTRIPHFRELIVMAFECPHCNFRNNEVQFGGSFQEKGARYSTTLTEIKDLNRQIVKSDTGRIIFPAIDFEIPALAQRGQLNTVEGVLARAIDGLSESQPVRRITEPEIAAKIDAFITVLESYKSGAALPYPIIVDDIAGNSHLENPFVPNPDPHMEIVHYVRTAEQDAELGMVPASSRTDIEQPSASVPVGSATAILTDDEAEREFAKASSTDKEILILPGACHSCHQPGEVRMVVTDIPHFKEVILMAFSCDYCGFKSNEVKSGGAIPPKGKRIAARIENFPIDLNRDILKSQSAGLIIPELNFELSPGTLGGKFTTVEGLLQSAKDQLESLPFVRGDSADNEEKGRMTEFLAELSRCIAGERSFTLIIDDPLSNSYIQNIYAPDEDPAIVEEEYERTQEQNEALGLLDMKTEDY